jgi:hypothetical protein
MAVRFIHNANADHYRRLLHTELSDTLLTFVERRLAEEQAALEQSSETAVPIRTPMDAARMMRATRVP